jgi:alkylhydroperoxidase/carboxymuconolactone decarboxylase family protein YurZ
MNKNKIKQIDTLSDFEMLTLLSAASVLRKDRYFYLIIDNLLKRRYSAKKIYEALLQTYLFAGFPSALISLKIFNQIVSREKKYEGYDLHKYTERGKKNCKIIYGNKYEKLISNVKSLSPEMAEWLVVEGYGKVLGRKGLSLQEREVCIVSILAALKFRDQLYSHINGAIRVKVTTEFLKKIINNLQIISAKTASVFGMNVLKAFITKKESSNNF